MTDMAEGGGGGGREVASFLDANALAAPQRGQHPDGSGVVYTYQGSKFPHNTPGDFEGKSLNLSKWGECT